MDGKIKWKHGEKVDDEPCTAKVFSVDGLCVENELVVLVVVGGQPYRTHQSERDKQRTEVFQATEHENKHCENAEPEEDEDRINEEIFQEVEEPG